MKYYSLVPPFLNKVFIKNIHINYKKNLDTRYIILLNNKFDGRKVRTINIKRKLVEKI